MNERKNIKGIVIDPGHGGNDSGTVNNGIVEKDFNLEISKYMNDRFNELGIPSKLTRSSDEFLNQSTRPGRVQSFFGNGNDVLVISNHLNAGGGDGAEIIYSLRNDDTLSKKIATEFENAGQNVRKYYQKRLPGNPSKDYYYLLRETPNNETIIVEYGFTDSSQDDVSLIKNDWKKLAEAVIKGVSNYVGVNYKQVDTISNNDTKSESNDVYIVKKGDTLWNIAKTYGTTVNKIKELNNLSSNVLTIGQQLLIKPSNIYKVKSGDTLYSIAQKNNTTVSKIKESNNLSSDIIFVNQELNIPSNSQEYIVKKGDTLYDIAKTYNTTVNSLKQKNNLTSNLLSIGQKLMI